MARLGDIATYVNGFAFKPSDWSNEGLPIIRIQDLTGNSYQANCYNGSYHPKYEVNDGDVLISWSASLGVYVWKGEKAVLNQHIFKVVFDKSEVDKNFFVHQVQNILENAASEAHGATMKHLTKPVFDALPFYLPSIEKQKEIASVLDKVTELIALRKEQLAKLDELVKARFVELFENNNYPVIKLGEVCTKITDGTHKTPTYLESGITFISAKNIVNGELDFSDIKYISEQEYAEIQKRCQTEIGDILLSKSGSLGSPVIVRTTQKLGLFESLAVIKYDRDRLLPEFLCEQLKTDRIQRQFKVGTKGVAIKHLHLGVIADTGIIVPSIEEQNQFAAFVEQTDKSKSEIQKSLEKLETLKKALMLKYFG
ncbi:MAG: restriction endonuclease subunit S [Ruminococcaceae bacterium]|nr:restriction endonuclease subunit S [Oscillospiraceae bacterium]